MPNSASTFIQNRKRVVQITYDRINHIIWYVAECYQILKNDSPTYSKKWVKDNTTLNFEDYLKMELVDNYLMLYKRLILNKCSQLGNINFHFENQKRYIDIDDSKEKPDKIDIYINRLGLQELWNEQDENVYFVIECKRIGILSDCKAYIDDTQKYSNRQYKNLRLPFEGQLAFIENSKLNHKSVSTEINKRLKNTPTITTTQSLQPIKIHSIFRGSYLSKHNRNHTKKEGFEISHLLFDYSQFVIN